MCRRRHDLKRRGGLVELGPLQNEELAGAALRAGIDHLAWRETIAEIEPARRPAGGIVLAEGMQRDDAWRRKCSERRLDERCACTRAAAAHRSTVASNRQPKRDGAINLASTRM